LFVQESVFGCHYQLEVTNFKHSSPKWPYNMLMATLNPTH